MTAIITILGGELLCSAGDRKNRLAMLQTQQTTMSNMDVTIAGEKTSFPYYRIDNCTHFNHPSLADACLEQVVARLFTTHPLTPQQRAATGLFLGSSSQDYSLSWNLDQAVFSSPLAQPPSSRVGGGCSARTLMTHFKLGGPSLSFNTACTSSANALITAVTMLKAGIIEYALVIGVEFASCLGLEGFIVMQLLSPDTIKPFAEDRNGMVLGEAVSAVLLSREDVRASSWHYLGGASACETSSVTGTDPGGAGMAMVMADALNNAQTTPDDVRAIKAHGTGGELMDLAELRAMGDVFSILPPYSSLKPYLGHTLGACGTAELLLLMESIDHGRMPATPNCQRVAREFSQPPLQENLSVNRGKFMLNSFGFGGNNTSFIIEKTA